MLDRNTEGTEVPRDWSWQNDLSDYEIEMDRVVGTDWDCTTIEMYADCHGLTLEMARLDLAKKHYDAAVDMHWIDHRAFYWRIRPRSERPPTPHELRMAACPLIQFSIQEPPGCRWCGKPLTGMQIDWCTDHNKDWGRNHEWPKARRYAMQLAGERCSRCEDSATDVNHIVPCLGKHNEKGCWHHQDNLEALCRPCHITATNEQHDAGMMSRPR